MSLIQELQRRNMIRVGVAYADTRESAQRRALAGVSRELKPLGRATRRHRVRPGPTGIMCGSSLVAIETFDAVRIRGNTQAHECTAEQELVVAELKGDGGWLTCS